jgi:choline dehydrogenase
MTTYDYVIVGAGSAGCVLANRLSADPSVRVLLLEAGGSDRKLNVRIPTAFAKQFRSDLDWNYSGEPEPNLIGRSIYLPRGRSLGGSSSMNAMIYIRGHRSDFDTWAAMGADGWSYDEVLPYFKRSEDNERIHDELHGTGGGLNVADPVWTSPLTKRFIESAKAAGLRRNDDFNGVEQDGVGRFQLTQKRGRRWSAADAFLHPVKKERPNLVVETGAHVHKVLLEGTRAAGVEYHDDDGIQTARAGAEVILSAGAFNSPQLLMLSGIGPADHLRSVGVDVAVDSPHVGEHLQDHPLATVTYSVNEPVTLFDATHPKYLVEYLLGQGRGKLSSNVAEAGAFIRTRDGLRSPDMELLMGAAYYSDNGFRTYPGHAFTIGPSFIRPTSEGSVRLRSSNPHDAPLIHLNWLSERSEVEAMIAALRTSFEIAENGALGELVETNIDPGPGVRSDEQLEAWLRAEVQHTYHASCTCRMGGDGDGVLDPSLRVRGVDGLRVADASSMPIVTGGNTNAPAIMIGEKAADLILGATPPAAVRGAATQPAAVS